MLNLILLLIFEFVQKRTVGIGFNLHSSQALCVFFVYNFIWAFLVTLNKNFGNINITRVEFIYKNSIKTYIFHLLLFSIYFLLDQYYYFLDKIYFLGLLALVMLVYYTISRFLITYLYMVLPSRLNFKEEVTLIGSGADLQFVKKAFGSSKPFLSLNSIENCADPKDREANLQMYKNYFETIAKEGVHEVYVISTPEMQSYTKDMVIEAEMNCVQINFVPSNDSYGYSTNPKSLEMALPVLKSHESKMEILDNRLKKRLVDLMISSLVIVFILSWLIPVIGLLIKLQSPGPVFFRQLRSGKNNEPFYCYKFRSMRMDNRTESTQASKGDKRIFPLGAFLRKSSLDEFPQFINVFLGQMSVVGPRPHMLAHTEHYSKLVQHYMARHFVKPGITGWAQVNGFRGETKDPALMAKRVEYDVDYMNNWSAMLDFKIFYMTIINMARGEKNAY